MGAVRLSKHQERALRILVAEGEVGLSGRGTRPSKSVIASHTDPAAMHHSTALALVNRGVARYVRGFYVAPSEAGRQWVADHPEAQ